MATSRPIRQGDRLTILAGGLVGGGLRAEGGENADYFVLQKDFGLLSLTDKCYRENVCFRVFGVRDYCSDLRDPRLAAAITNSTAPGLYVREGDDTSNWEVYREVLARRVEEAMAARRGEVVRVETTAIVRRFGPGPRKCSTNGLFIGVTAPFYIEWSGTAMFYVYSDGRREQTETTLEHCLNSVLSGSYVELPVGSTPRLAPDHASSATRQDDEIRVGDVVEVVSCSDIHYTNRGDIGSGGRITRRGDNSVQLVRFDSMRLPGGGVAAIGDVRKVTSSPSSLITVAANVSPMPDVQPPMPLSRPAHQPAPPQPSSPSRFSLLEVDADVKPPAPQAPKASTGLAALQQELRAEREAKRALAAAHTPPGRFNLLECDLPAVAVKAPTKHPVVSSLSPKPLSPVETITDLTAVRSPLELARMLAGLDGELSTMMRQREAN